MRIFLRIAAIGYIGYLVISLLIISPALNFLPHKYMQDNYGRELQTGWVLFNPFKLSLDISDAALKDDTGEPFLAFSEASVNLSVQSLWQTGWVLDVVKVRDLYLDVTRMTEEEYSFSDLLPVADTAEEPPETEVSEIPGLTIHDLELHSETIVLTDQARSTPYSSRWNGLHIRVTEISTVNEDGRPYIIDLRGDGGGELHWEGEISLPNGTSSGQLSVSNLNLHNVWKFAQPWLQFELKEGRLDVSGQYALDWSHAFSYQVSNGRLKLYDIDIVPQAPDQIPDTALSLQSLEVDDIALDSSTQRLTINSVQVAELAVATWQEDATVSLEDLFAVATVANEEEEDTDEPQWSISLNKAQISDSKLRWRSQLTDPQILEVQPIEATIENISWPPSGETRLSLTLTVNEQAKIAVTSALALGPGDGSLEYSLDGLPLAWFNPNLPAALKASITGGHVEVKGQVNLKEYGPTTIALDGAILDFSARREGAEVRLTGWDAFRIKGLAIDMEQHNVALENLAIDNYIGRIHIQEDGSINTSNIWKEEVGEQADEIAEELAQDKPWSFQMPAVTITDSEVDFMDRSLPIQFRTVIGDINGDIRNISSEPGAEATVNIKGSVDSYAPVALKGKVSPFAEPTALNLNLTFDGVDMGLLSPYSGTYAGYAIDRGLLNLNLQYGLKNNQLEGQNSVRIEKLKLGKKVDSEKAVDLPLELAIAIMTDSNGVIDIQVPVSGDVNSPDFELGGVISTAFVNLLTKAITAPFTLLAGLVNSEEDLQRVTFASGYADLNDRSKEKLTQLGAALAQRPSLSMGITGRLNISSDRERLQKNALKAQLIEEGLTTEEVEAKGADWEDAIEDRYEDLPSIDAEIPPETVLDKYARVFQSIEIPDQQMTKLAEERAVAVKGFLVNEVGLAPARAVVEQSYLDDPGNEFSGAELSIED